MQQTTNKSVCQILYEYQKYINALAAMPDGEEKKHIDDIAKSLTEILDLNSGRLSEDEEWLWNETACSLSFYLEYISDEKRKMFLGCCQSVLGQGKGIQIAHSLETKRYESKDEELKKEILHMLIRADAWMEVLDELFEEHVICTQEEQDVMRYIEAVNVFLEEIPDLNLDEKLHIYNQSLIAVKEALWNVGVTESDEEFVYIAGIRDRVKHFLSSGYG